MCPKAVGTAMPVGIVLLYAAFGGYTIPPYGFPF